MEEDILSRLLAPYGFKRIGAQEWVRYNLSQRPCMVRRNSKHTIEVNFSDTKFFDVTPKILIHVLDTWRDRWLARHRHAW